ncbi:hypothetical protein [Planotetraspora sp. GP83]|uniref:hypothetical protein n=1 Tax=Planotetraspora sp. GP83 TaxID=3156264 RepID=UPI003517C032
MIEIRTAAMGMVLAGADVAAFTGSALADPGASPNPRRHDSFDLQAHRGGLGLVVESTLDSFANGLRVGVSTLELDI